MRARPVEEPVPDDSQAPFQYSRMLFSQLGFLSWDKRGQVQLLKKCDKLLRELKNLDNQVFLLTATLDNKITMPSSGFIEMPRNAQNCRHLRRGRSRGQEFHLVQLGW